MRNSQNRHESNEQFECDFEGKFTPETEAHLAHIQAEHGHITCGHLYSLVQDEGNKMVLEITGPKAATDALDITGCKVIARNFAFRAYEKVKKEVDGEWVDCVQDSRTNFRCRSVLVPIGKSGFAVKFKYHTKRKCMVVC